MIQHVVYFQLRPEVDKPAMEQLVRMSRSFLLKIPEVRTVRSGRNLDPISRWQFYFSAFAALIFGGCGNSGKQKMKVWQTKPVLPVNNFSPDISWESVIA